METNSIEPRRRVGLIECSNEKLPGGSTFTIMRMTNGDTIMRIKTKDGQVISSTVGGDWQLSRQGMPWQEAHYHSGQTEIYTQQSGWSAHLWVVDERVYNLVLSKPGDDITFWPKIPHLVLLGPSAFVTTALNGTAVINQESREDDCWPVPSAFQAKLDEARIEFEKILAKRL